jgi:hypothetical protein
MVVFPKEDMMNSIFTRCLQAFVKEIYEDFFMFLPWFGKVLGQLEVWFCGMICSVDWILRF